MPSLRSVCFPQARAPSAPAEPATAAAAAAAAPVKKAAPRPSRLRKAAAVPAQRRVAAAAAAAEELDFAARGDAEKTAAGAATAEGGAAGGAAASGGGDAEELAGRDALTLVPARTRRGRPKVGDCVPNARTHSFMFTPGGMLVAEGAAGNGYRSPRGSDVFLQVQLSTTLTRHYRGGAGVVLAAVSDSSISDSERRVHCKLYIPAVALESSFVFLGATTSCSSQIAAFWKLFRTSDPAGAVAGQAGASEESGGGCEEEGVQPQGRRSQAACSRGSRG